MNLICCGGAVKIAVLEVPEEGVWEVLVLVDPEFFYADEVIKFLLVVHRFKEVQVESGFGKEYCVFVKKVSEGDVREYAVELW